MAWKIFNDIKLRWWIGPVVLSWCFANCNNSPNGIQNFWWAYEDLKLNESRVKLLRYFRLLHLPCDNWLGWIWQHEDPFCGEFHDSQVHFIAFHTLFSIFPPADSHQRPLRQQRLSSLLQLTAQIPSGTDQQLSSRSMWCSVEDYLSFCFLPLSNLCSVVFL